MVGEGWPATGRWFSPGTPVSSINKADRYDITEIVLKVALYNIILILSAKHGTKHIYVSINHSINQYNSNRDIYYSAHNAF